MLKKSFQEKIIHLKLALLSMKSDFIEGPCQVLVNLSKAMYSIPQMGYLIHCSILNPFSNRELLKTITLATHLYDSDPICTWLVDMKPFDPFIANFATFPFLYRTFLGLML